jgi:hypothetical protein
METELRRIVAGDHQVRIRLVVLEQDVEARLVRLDQAVLEEQRLGFVADDGRLDAADVRDHHADAEVVAVLLESTS